MTDAPHTNREAGAEMEYQAGAACALQTGISVADLVAELRRAASIVEGAGHEELADKLRNWAICVADVVSVHRQGDHNPEVYVG